MRQSRKVPALACACAALFAASAADGAPPRRIEPPLGGGRTPPRRVQAVRPGSLRPSAVPYGELNRLSSEGSVEKARADAESRKREIRAFAKRLEGTTESSLTKNGAIRGEMVSADVDPGRADEMVSKLKAAAPAMREAGSEVSRAMDELDRKAAGAK